MPFKLQSGEYYFEAVRIWDDEKAIHQTYLALRPLCAAKYKYSVKNDETAIRQLKDALRDLQTKLSDR